MYNGGRRREARVLATKLHSKRNGRLRVQLCKDGERKLAFVHHLVLNAFVGPKPSGLEACHRNDNPFDNTLPNLRWDTHTANMQDSIRNGSRPRGEMNPSAKLTDDGAATVRRLLASGVGVRETARRLDMNSGTISRLNTGKTWRNRTHGSA